MEGEEQIFPCKGCGEILEEGKAFELAGNRWHIDCFRCNTCGTLLDSDANLLLLGDGSLICNNCTYSCSACGNKIEDLAILTGDQAFCANCFKCRNCKRKIDNLRYARTSQGIFCMSCHESLMARRRKRSKMPRTASANSNPPGGAVVLDKSLPALPPHVVSSSTFPPPSDSDAATLAGSLAGSSPSASVLTNPLEAQKENAILPSSTYGGSNMSTPTIENDSVPIAFNPQEDISMLSVHSQRHDYSSNSKHSSVSAIMRDDYQDLITGSSRSASTDGVRKRSPALPSQHIASQQRGRQSSTEMADTLRRRQSNDATPSTATSPTAAAFDRTRLSPAYEPPDPLDRAGSRVQENLEQRFEAKHSSLSAMNSPTGPGAPSTFEDSINQELRRRGSFKRSPLTSPVLQGSAFDRPARDDSLNKVISRKEVPNGNNTDAQHERKESNSAFSRKDSIAGKTISRPIAAGVTNTLSADGVPMRSPRRPNSARPDDESEFIAPRNAPPPPPVDQRHRNNASISSIQSEHFSTGELTPTAEDEPEVDGPAGLFRKVSKAVRHGRSHSDKISAMPSQRWKRNGSTDISSPILASPNTAEETVQLRNKLRFAQQRVTELEAEKVALEERVNGTVDLRQMNTELREKRSTMAFLDTQREMVIRELEVMTDHLSKAKDGNNRNLNIEAMQAEVLRDFAASLSRLKDQMSGQIEELVQKKNEITNQISSLIQMKDKGFQEYEALSTRNTQLSELNNQLIQNIQDQYKQSRQPGGQPPPPPIPQQQQHQQTNALPPNGLGIYTQQAQRDSNASDFKSLSITESNYSGDTQVEAGTMLDAPQVVDIRKAKKFNWRRGGQTVAKGLKNALIGPDQGKGHERDNHFLEGARYDHLPAGELPTTGSVPYNQTRAGTGSNSNNAPGSWGAFLAPRPPGTGQKPSSRDGTPNASSITLSPNYPDASTTLFGSDLSARCNFERHLIPTIVSRCISEVETRGMNIEGVYRKSGSSSQIKMIQAGFERDWERFEVNDEDIDVHAITSTLKQYFRRLPNPLITFECYDGLLEAVGGVEGVKDVVGGGDEWIARRLAVAVGRLPDSHRETLEFLIGHLVRVMAMEGENLMTSLNLAVVFAPTIMRPQTIEREMSDMTAQRTAVQCMLEHSRIVFEEE